MFPIFDDFWYRLGNRKASFGVSFLHVEIVSGQYIPVNKINHATTNELVWYRFLGFPSFYKEKHILRHSTATYVKNFSSRVLALAHILLKYKYLYKMI